MILAHNMSAIKNEHTKLYFSYLLFFSRSVLSDFLQPHGLQHARLPCPSPTPRAAHTKSVIPSNHPVFCHPLLLLLSTFPSIRVFSLSRLLTSGGQSIRASASTSVLSNEYSGLIPLGLTGWISLQSKGLSRIFSNTTAQKHKFFGTQLSLWSNSHIHT